MTTPQPFGQLPLHRGAFWFCFLQIALIWISGIQGRRGGMTTPQPFGQLPLHRGGLEWIDALFFANRAAVRRDLLWMGFLRDNVP